MSRRMKRALLALAVVLALVAGVWFMPAPYYVITPGLTLNLDHVVHVQGGKPPTKGRLMMVAVTMQPSNLYYYLLAKISPYAELVPLRDIVPPGGTPQQYQKQSRQEMASSHSEAKVAAEKYLGYPAKAVGTGVEVLSVLKGDPAAGNLRQGDVIHALNGHQVLDASQLLSDMKGVKPGSAVKVTIERAKKTLALSVGTVPKPGNPSEALMGVGVATYHLHYVIPVPVKIDTGAISGPSAGMMFAVEIVAQLRPGWHLTEGLPIAGTGVISPDGSVGDIGGVREKLVTVYRSGAKIFFVPQGNYAAAHQQLLRLGLNGKIKLVPVKNLGQVIAYLRSLKSTG